MPLSINRLNTKIRPTMLCLSGFELYSRWVPQFPFLFLTHSLFFSDIPGSQPLFHSDFFIQHARKSTIQRPFRFLGYSFMLRLRYIRGGGTWVLFGWVCAARDSKLAPRSKKISPKIDTPF